MRKIQKKVLEIVKHNLSVYHKNRKRKSNNFNQKSTQDGNIFPKIHDLFQIKIKIFKKKIRFKLLHMMDIYKLKLDFLTYVITIYCYSYVVAIITEFTVYVQ